MRKFYEPDQLRKYKGNEISLRSLFFFVNQKGKLQGVVEYRFLNRIKEINQAPITRMDDIIDRLVKIRIFSELDLKSRFHQIHVLPGNKDDNSFKKN